MRSRATISLFLLLLLLRRDTHAQMHLAAGDHPQAFVAPGFATSQGTVTYSVSRDGKVLDSCTFDRTEEVRVIVKFESPPLSHAQKSSKGGISLSSLASIQTGILSDHTRFRSDLARIESEDAAAWRGRGNTLTKTLPKSIIHAEYSRLLNGAALSTRRSVLGKLQALSYVKSISPDRLVHGVDQESNHLIGADSTWVQIGVTGKGVRLGILDSGIDYTLPELGGGFGPGYKVRGGYDFVNNDPNPLDDNGHGTEVASVIAAKGSTLSGVAPDAVLYSYKVLDQLVQGSSSVAILALERALQDSVEIVNLSFGGVGDPTDPLSEAVDNATSSGILCVVAAGNSGASYQTIGSPGCATGALTVGASDKYDQAAFFSSRGPTDVLFALKPDLLAPGVSITTLTSGGGSQSVDGTSFAAPHVSGASALLKELHRDWTPEMTKSALMGSARDIGEDLWTQGRGRVDVLQAAKQKVLALPQSLSLGLDDMSQTLWVRTDTVLLENLSNQAETFSIAGPGALPAGISVSVSPQQLTVPAQGTGSVIVQTRVDNSVAQIPSDTPPAVTGTIHCTSPDETFAIPFALLMGSYIDLEVVTTLGEVEVWFARSDGSSFKSSSGNDMGYAQGRYTVRRLLPPGLYETVALLGWAGPGVAWVLRDSVLVSPMARVSLNQAEAIYTVGTTPKDENGEPLDSTTGIYWNARMYSSRTNCSFGAAGYDGLPLWENQMLEKLPKTSSNYIFDYSVTTDPELPKVYTYAGRLSSIEADHIVNIGPGELKRRTIDYRLHTLAENLASIYYFYFSNDLAVLGWYSPQYSHYVPSPYHQEWYSAGEPTENFPYNQWLFNFRQLFSYSGVPPFDPNSSPYLFLTPNQHPGTDGILRSTLLYSKTPALETRGTKVIYGLGPRFYFGRTDNTSSTIKVKTNTWIGMSDGVSYVSERYLPIFLNQALDYCPSRLSFRLWDSQGSLRSSGTSADHFLEEGTPDGLYYDRSLAVPLPQAGHYTLEVTDTESWILQRQGTSRVLLSMDTRLSDKNPPSMTSFTILADSEHADQVLTTQKGEIHFQVSDQEGPLNGVNLFFRTDVDTVWRPLPLNHTEGTDKYYCLIPDTLPEAYIHLRVFASDVSGNSLDYRAEPAFYYGVLQNHPPTPARLLAPGAGDTLQLYQPGKPIRFTWHPARDYDPGDTVRYDFRFWSGDSSFCSIATSCRDTTVSFTFMSRLKARSLYHWTVTASDGHFIVPSDTVTFRTSDVILALPEEDQANLPKEYGLLQNYPNPFNPTTQLRFALPEAANVSLIVYDILGREVSVLARGLYDAGYHTESWDGSRFASGVYFARFAARDQLGNTKYTKVNKLLLTK